MNSPYNVMVTVRKEQDGTYSVLRGGRRYMTRLSYTRADKVASGLRSYRRRRNAGRRRNPDAPISTALTWLGGGAIIGAGLGALSNTDRAIGALAGAEGGVAIVGVGGLLVALFKKPARPAGFAAAGIGLGGLVLLGVAMSVVSPTKGSIGAGKPLFLPLQSLHG